MDTEPSRIQAARDRAAAAKKLLAAAAAALFATVLVGVRLSHPGDAAASSGTSVDQTANDSETQSFDFGQSEIGPSDGSGAGASGSTHAS